MIEVSTLAQLAAIRADLNGDGVSPAPFYAAAFPDAMPGMGCPDAGCTGYELVANLDFDTNGNGETDAGDAYWDDGAGWIPIGDGAHKFTADFDGNNHTIANLYINRGDAPYVGLFGYARGNSIKQVGLASATVSSRGSVGGLVGYSYDSAISDSYVAGSVSGRGRVGGLVGHSYQVTISDSYAMGNVSGRNHVGGLVGSIHRDGTISRSYATSSVSGDYAVGGLIGNTDSNTISYSYATGSVSGGSAVGGLAGENEGDTIIASYATGSVFGDHNVGGLVGSSDSSTFIIGKISRIRYSYATGSVSGSDYVGGLVGSSDSGTISASYATGGVAGEGDDIGGLVGRNEGGAITASYAVGRVSTSGDTFYIGGLVGYHEGGDIIASYWDTQTTGQAGSYGGVGKTTAELQSPAGYTGIYADWNGDLDGDGNSDDPWDFGAAGQYPVLKYGGLDVAAQRQ